MHSLDRLCACGCGRPVPPDAPAKRIWASDACRQRGHRNREKGRAVTRAASVAAAVAHRGGHNLHQLLDLAHREAQRRPGSVVLRAAGRLVVLTAEDLKQLSPAPATAPASELAEQIQRVIQSWSAVRRDGETVKLATRIAPSRAVVAEAEHEFQRLEALGLGAQPRPARLVVPAELLALRERLEDLVRWPLLQEGQVHLIPHDVLKELIGAVDHALPAPDQYRNS